MCKAIEEQLNITSTPQLIIFAIDEISLILFETPER